MTVLVCLDASFFLAWLRGEDAPAGLRSVIFQMMVEAESDTEAESGKKPPRCQFVVSSHVLAEVAPREDYKQEYDQFLEAIQQSCEIFALDVNIARRAGEVRRALSVRGSRYPYPDAIHVATAIYSNAQYLCTLDKKHMLNRKKDIADLSDGRTKVISPQEVPGIPLLL